MEDNIIDTLKIEIVGDSGKAVDSIGKLISTLEKIKGATSGSNKGLNAIQKNLSKISDAVSKIDSNSTSKLRDLADGLKGLNEVGNIKTGKTADRIVDLGAAVDLLKDVDFSKLTELANGLQALGNAGNVNVPHFDNNSSPADAPAAPTSSMDGEVVIPPSTIEDTRSALNNLSADLNKNRSLWTDIANVGRSAFQRIDAALTPIKAKVAGVAIAGVMQFNILKAKLSDVASAVSAKVGRAFDGLKQKMQPVGNAARYVWNTITQPIQGVVSALGRVGGKFGEILSKAKSALAPIGTIAKSAFGKLGSLAGQGAKAVTKSFLKIAGSPIKKLKESLSNATSKVGEFFTMFKKRAFYRAINAVISAITTGFKEGTANVYQYSKAIGGTLASSLDSISTNFLYLKNSIGAACAPLINMLAPAIEYVVDKCVALLNILNQVFAKISGASTWTKAVKYPTEYAEAANGATAANKELKKSILGIDEINPLQDNSSGSGGGGAGGMDYSSMFEEQELGDIANPFTGFFKPFADAWANEGQNTINAIKSAFEGVKDFCSAVGESFREVWTNGTGQQTLETILRIFQNILKCVGNLGTGLATAWRANDNGTKILQNIWNIFNDLLSFVEGIYGATADWLATLDFTPLMTAFAGCTAALEPLVDLIGGTLLWLYQTVLLPIAGWAIKNGSDTILTITELTGSAGTNNKTISLTSSQRTTILNAMSTVQSFSATYVLTTYSGSTQIGSTSFTTGTIQTTASVSKPTFTNFTYADINTTTKNVTGNASLFVQSKSYLQVNCTAATAKNGASIAKYRVTIGEKTVYTTATTISFGAIPDAGSLSLIVTAIDSRGYETSVTKTITVIDYENITIDSYQIRRENNVEDTIQLKFSGSLSSVTVSGTAKNSFVSAQYRTKNVSSTSWSSYTAISGVESSTSGFSFDNDAWITLSSSNAYYVQITVSDKLSTNTVTLYINKGQPLVSFRAKKVGINTNDPQSALDVNGNIMMNGYNVQGYIGAVASGSDLNNMLVSGIYYVPLDNTIVNRPQTNAVAVLEVIEVTSAFLLQRFTCVDGKVYCRGKYNTTWHDWA